VWYSGQTSSAGSPQRSVRTSAALRRDWTPGPGTGQTPRIRPATAAVPTPEDDVLLSSRNGSRPRGDRIHLSFQPGEYTAHYNRYRPHQSLGQRPPHPPPQVIDLTSARVQRCPVLGGLINEYAQAA
jgi:hypothetical protein